MRRWLDDVVVIATAAATTTTEYSQERQSHRWHAGSDLISESRIRGEDRGQVQLQEVQKSILNEQDHSLVFPLAAARIVSPLSATP